MSIDVLTDSFAARFSIRPIELELEQARKSLEPTEWVPEEWEWSGIRKSQEDAVFKVLEMMSAYDDAQKLEKYKFRPLKLYDVNLGGETDLYQVLDAAERYMTDKVKFIRAELRRIFGESLYGYTVEGMPKVASVVGFVHKSPNYRTQAVVTFEFERLPTVEHTMNLEYFTNGDEPLREAVRSYWRERKRIGEDLGKFFQRNPKGLITCKICFAFASEECDRCRLVNYCSEDCQSVDWLNGHRDVCTPQN